MNDSQAIISDLHICDAFNTILKTPLAQFQQKVDSPAYADILNYLNQLPSAEKSDPAKMANHITAFCEQYESLEDWLGEIYDQLDNEGIDYLVKKPRDPGEEADAEPEDLFLIRQKSRDICQEIEQIAAGNEPESNEEETGNSERG